MDFATINYPIYKTSNEVYALVKSAGEELLTQRQGAVKVKLQM